MKKRCLTLTAPPQKIVLALAQHLAGAFDADNFKDGFSVTRVWRQRPMNERAAWIAVAKAAIAYRKVFPSKGDRT